MQGLDSKKIQELLQRLGDLAQGQGLRLHLVLAGGAAISLLGWRARTTKDVDAIIIQPTDTGVVRRLIAQIGQENDLSADWLNDAMKGYLNGISLGPVLIDHPGIIVQALGHAQLLAMKICAWRDDVDIDDAVALLSYLQGDQEEVWSQVEPFLIVGRELKARYAFEDLWGSIHE